jgi:hypothetical protein
MQDLFFVIIQQVISTVKRITIQVNFFFMLSLNLFLYNRFLFAHWIETPTLFQLLDRLISYVEVQAINQIPTVE